uniref:Uncharacterized protein n=1 Tax=Leersia perrieri TaxID=77586 RepID=A0A0D9VVE4_9ORYZ
MTMRSSLWIDSRRSKYRGFQVALAELETLLITHPSIADAVVDVGRKRAICSSQFAGLKQFVLLRASKIPESEFTTLSNGLKGHPKLLLKSNLKFLFRHDFYLHHVKQVQLPHHRIVPNFRSEKVHAKH